MLQILYGPDWCANSDALMQLLATDVHSRRENILLMVPELISHETERRLCGSAGDTASRYAQVISFSRLSRLLSQYTGSQVPACMDGAGRVLAMASAARQLHGSLKTYASVESKPAFLTSMVDAVDEFKRCCIGAGDLRAAGLRGEGVLAQKMEELALLLDAYDGVCANGKRDPRDLLNWVLEELSDSDFAQTHTLFIDGFPDFTRQHTEILKHFIVCCPKVVIAMNCDSFHTDQLAFEKAAETARMLQSFAKAQNIPVQCVYVAPREDALSYPRKMLLQGKTVANEHLNQVIYTSTAPTIYRECQEAAIQIQALVRGGARYRDISVVCNQLSGYRQSIVRVFRQMGIPYYLAGTESILDNPAMDTVFSILDVVDSGFELRSVLHYLRSALSPLDTEHCDLVENYAIVWNVNGGDWCQEWTLNPNGLSSHFDDSDREILARTEMARSFAMAPLVEFSQDIKAASSVQQQIAALRKCLDRIGMEETLSAIEQQQILLGDEAGAQVYHQIGRIFTEALAQMEDVLGTTAWDRESFTRMLALLISQYDVGTIPAKLDAVSVGKASALRCNRQKYLVALGCTEGSFPGYNGSAGLLSDRERDQLRNLDLPLTGGALEGIQAEYAELYGVVCGTSKQLYLYCSGGEPSFVFRRLSNMTTRGVDVISDGCIPFERYVAAGLLARSSMEKEADSLGLEREYEQLTKKLKYQMGNVEGDTVSKIVGSKLRIYASNVDTFASCRFSFLLKYLLQLKEQRIAKIDSSEFGTYLHYVLEKTVQDVMKQGGFHKVALEDTLMLAHLHSEAYIRTYFAGLDTQRMEYFAKKNTMELDYVVESLWDEMHNAAYEPVAVELKIDERNHPIVVHGKIFDAVLTGKIDRVDRFTQDDRNYFRVVDYKTGGKEIDFSLMYNGLGLQMLLYLFSIEKTAKKILGNHPIPAGVLYFPAKAEYLTHTDDPKKTVSNRQMSFRRRGLYLNDDISIKAMDPRDGMPSLDLKFVKKNNRIEGHLASLTQLRLLQKHIEVYLQEMVDAVAAGDMAPDPYANGDRSYCDYCPYHQVCKRDEGQPFRQLRKLDDAEFWQWLERKVNG